MKAGNFNINTYLQKLYENAEELEKAEKTSSEFSKEGLIIPKENKKSYDWLKREYNKAKTEVKVEISGQGASFKPGYDMQASTDSVKEFKPGLFGEVKTIDTEKTDKKDNLDSKKNNPSFKSGEGDAIKKETNKTFNKEDDIKDKESDEQTSDDESSKEKPEVKKIDLKTKKK